MREIDDMIYQCSDPRKKVILLRLKALNTLANSFMAQPNNIYKTKYKALQKTEYWKEAKVLIKEYKEIEGIFNCEICGKSFDLTFTMHHDLYGKDSDNYFTPIYIKFVCNFCHKKIHNKKEV